MLMAGINSRRTHGAKIKDAGIGKDEQQETRQEQKNNDGDVTCQTAEKLSEFLFANGPHRRENKDIILCSIYAFKMIYSPLLFHAGSTGI
jgi:hypothetical protein